MMDKVSLIVSFLFLCFFQISKELSILGNFGNAAINVNNEIYVKNQRVLTTEDYVQVKHHYYHVNQTQLSENSFFGCIENFNESIIIGEFNCYFQTYHWLTVLHTLNKVLVKIDDNGNVNNTKIVSAKAAGSYYHPEFNNICGEMLSGIIYKKNFMDICFNIDATIEPDFFSVTCNFLYV